MFFSYKLNILNVYFNVILNKLCTYLFFFVVMENKDSPSKLGTRGIKVKNPHLYLLKWLDVKSGEQQQVRRP